MQSHHLHDLPWQYAVYIRKNTRERYSFSHIKHTRLSKAFPNSLRVSDVQLHGEIMKVNEAMFKTATVLILVTGEKAHVVSYRSFADNSRNCVEYDHLERMAITEDDRHKPTFSDLRRGYMALTYHCTLASYEQGVNHRWDLAGVVPMLSDIIVLPRVLTLKAVRPIMSAYCRAIKKSYRDSLLLADSLSFRELSMAPVVKQSHESEEHEPKDSCMGQTEPA